MTEEPAGWRQNANLVECFENCVAMFGTMAAGPLQNPSTPSLIKQRREALGLTKAALGVAAGFSYNGASTAVGRLERTLHAPGMRRRVEAALARFEATRATDGCPVSQATLPNTESSKESTP